MEGSRLAAIGSKRSPEAIEKMRQAKLGKPSGRLGIPTTPEVKAKLSAALKANGANSARLRSYNLRRSLLKPFVSGFAIPPQDLMLL